jgi:hypothetical protein
MDRDHTVLHLATVTAPLPVHSDRLAAALAHTRLVDHPNRLRMGMLGGHDLLATVAELGLVPLDRFEKTL